MGTFGDFISRLRNYSKITQEQLAEQMEVSKTTIQNWESGRTKVKSAHLKKLAYLFNVSETVLISELNRDNDSMRNDKFPYFLIDDDEELTGIIKSLHLNLNQQELFGLICLYCPDSLQYISQEAAFQEAIMKIPYEFVCKVGSIQFMNLSDGLKHLLKYVEPNFLLKVLKLYLIHYYFLSFQLFHHPLKEQYEDSSLNP
ncbi:MAG: helix-turn-helix transcriptional regulator [Ruminiclostridium sp.]|nr:helix-turn-helix transcriptional regulator [Ruminiclostridium sp.]